MAEQTQFNGLNLLDGSFTAQTFQVGANQGQTIQIAEIVSAQISELGSWTSVGQANSTGASGTFAGVVAGAIVTGLGGGLLLPTLLCWNMGRLPAEHRALGTGAWNAAFFFGQFLTPIVVVGIAGALGGLPRAMQLMGLVLVPCAVLLSVVSLRRPAAAAGPLAGG